MSRRVLVIGLDGYEPAVGEALMAEGRLPNLRALAGASAEFALDHGSAKRTGLAWEHVSLGKSPQAYGRHAAVRLDTASYEASQFGTVSKPLLAGVDVRAVVFDAPYFDLLSAPNCQGLVSWGAHDAGIAPQCAPAGLQAEMEARFGPYPAKPYIYGFVWPNAESSRAMADALIEATRLRGEIGLWLLSERLPEWDLGMLVFSEFHSAIEALWHGWDASHPLHGLPSAIAARDGITSVYEAFDESLGSLRSAFPDVDFVLFSMHGMGPNDSDVPTMLLLPELLYQQSFGRSLFEPRADWKTAFQAGKLPMLDPGESWSRAVNECLVETGTKTQPVKLDWMPASQYRLFWPRMEAFALPSYYDGRIRINLRGRERDGLVRLADYPARLERLCKLLREIHNPQTGGSVIQSIDLPVEDDPLNADATQADLIITWKGAPLAFFHESTGLIGPAPYRRTGGHSGRQGIAWITSAQVPRGRAPTASSFDVMPTVIALLGREIPPGTSGRSLALQP